MGRIVLILYDTIISDVYRFLKRLQQAIPKSLEYGGH